MTVLTPAEQQLRNNMFAQGMLWCARCKQFHPVKDFVKSPSQDNYGYRRYCRRCEKQQNRERKEKIDNHNKQRNTALKAKFAELAGGCCQKCGYNRHYAALDFHHIYPAQKKYTPAYIIYTNNFEKAWRELDKCCLLCQNCHVTYEAGVWRAEFIKRDGLGWTVGGELPLDDKRYETKTPPKIEQAPLPLFTIKRAGEQLQLFEERATYVVF